MCGIFGYVGNKHPFEVIKKGLKRMEYRGYDSWGTAIIQLSNNKEQLSKNEIEVYKQVGAIDEITTNPQITNHKLQTTQLGIGHTRWATHGGVNETNAHPHLASDDSFALAQNGIVENYEELKSELTKKGYKFLSQTDTEVIVRLVEEKLKSYKDLKDAVRLAFLELEGRNTIIVLDKVNKRTIGIRNGSPLVVGMRENNEFFFSSDTLAFADYTNEVYLMDDFDMVVYDNKLDFFDSKTGKKLKKEITTIENFDSAITKEGYDHFMIKEINEQKDTIRQATNYSLDELKPLIQAIKESKFVYTVGAGTAAYAASEIAFFLRKYAGIHAIDLKSYETNSYKDVFTSKDLIIAVSQSGETADTIEAIEFAKNKGARVASIVNMMGSTISRISDYKFYSRTGPEICVASTKAFTAQISWGYLLTKSIAGDYKESKAKIKELSVYLKEFMNEELNEKIKKLTKQIKNKDHFFVLGKDQNYVIALEGALKIKEITYKHFEGFAAGELKHGVIALIDKGTPVFCIVSNDEVKKDIISAAAEVKARGAMVIGIGDVSDSNFFDYKIEFDVDSEVSTIANVIPFQLFSYHLGVELGNNIDKPRNLAKSVTVK